MPTAPVVEANCQRDWRTSGTHTRPSRQGLRPAFWSMGGGPCSAPPRRMMGEAQEFALGILPWQGRRAHPGICGCAMKRAPVAPHARYWVRSPSIRENAWQRRQRLQAPSWRLVLADRRFLLRI